VALAQVDKLVDTAPMLASYHAFHATRADLLRRLGRSVEAREAYDAALAVCDNTAERAYLARRRGELV
jgi:RNA polymerase sigma-70 factor, ECF subfamily